MDLRLTQVNEDPTMTPCSFAPGGSRR